MTSTPGLRPSSRVPDAIKSDPGRFLSLWIVRERPRAVYEEAPGVETPPGASFFPANLLRGPGFPDGRRPPDCCQDRLQPRAAGRPCAAIGCSLFASSWRLGAEDHLRFGPGSQRAPGGS